MEQVQSELEKLPGIGKKVADCIALFSLRQGEAIPVDTHVWHIACRWDPSLLKSKSLTPSIYKRVGDLFREKLKIEAGWAHQILFAAELPQFKVRLPSSIQDDMKLVRKRQKDQKEAQKFEREAKKAIKKENDLADQIEAKEEPIVEGTT
jgi:N-glycosylase/DNA lyase